MRCLRSQHLDVEIDVFRAVSGDINVAISRDAGEIDVVHTIINITRKGAVTVTDGEPCAK